MKKQISENSRKKFFIENYPFKADYEHLWESAYECIHCERRGLFKNYRTEVGEDMTYIMCEHEGCSGSVIDMIKVGSLEPMNDLDEQEIEFNEEANRLTTKEDVQKTIEWFIGILEEMGKDLEKWIGEAELGVNTTVEGRRDLNTDNHKVNCDLLIDYLTDKENKEDKIMQGAAWADEFVAIKLCHEVLMIDDPRIYEQMDKDIIKFL